MFIIAYFARLSNFLFAKLLVNGYHMDMTTPLSIIEDLALDMIGCVFDNDMPGLLQRLSLADGPQAALWDNSGALRVAIRKEHNHFLSVLLPYTCEEDAGHALSMCLAEGELVAFDTLVAYNTNFIRKLNDNALGWLAGHYLRALEDTSGVKKPLIDTYWCMLQRFFECIPSDAVEWQLGMMAQRAHESPQKAKSFEIIERLWSERNKSVLEQKLGCIPALNSSARKI